MAVKRYYIDKDADAHEHPEGYLVNYEDYAAVEDVAKTLHEDLVRAEAECERLRGELQELSGS